jgi:uncharacterized protein (DUF362 family)
MSLSPISLQGFVKIISFFSKGSTRDIDHLSDVYAHSDQLIERISKLTREEINLKEIENKNIFLKPNWVKHNTKAHDEICLRTNDAVTLALCEVVLQHKPKKVVIGDAPIQGCRWDDMFSDDFKLSVRKLSDKYNVEIVIKDLRRKVMNLSDTNMINTTQGLDDFIIFDVGQQSFLEPITKKDDNQFRVTHYNPDRFKESHGPGVHRYCITKELFDADVVISIPKTKTHEKSGITNALKNIVGLNGDKDFLPHHRIGGTKAGGDSYPGYNLFRQWSELCYDNANRNLGNKSYWIWVRIAALLWRISRPGPMDRFGAGWHGNDTTWRMVMDLNLVAHYGKSDGSLSDTPVRVLYSLCDGIIGGQKDGPLSPDPLPLGTLTWTNDSAWADICMATMMDMDITKLPLLIAAETFSAARGTKIFFNDELVDLGHLKNFSIQTEMPGGWVNYKN